MLLHDSFPTFNFEAIIFSISMVKIGIFFFSIGRGLHERGRCPTFPFGVRTVLGPCAESLEWMSFKHVHLYYLTTISGHDSVYK